MSDNLFLGDTNYPHTPEQPLSMRLRCNDDNGLTYATDLLMIEAADRIEQLEGMIKQEQNRAGRIGTHSYDCHTWGHQHYECLLRKFEEAQKGHARYEYVRKLNVMQFQEIYLLGFRTDVSFDGRIDSLIDAAIQEGK